MAHTIRMTVRASLQDGDLIFRVLNFKEDVHRELIRERRGVVDDPMAMSRALAPVVITVPRKRHLGRLSLTIAEALRRHEVGHAVQVVTGQS